MRTYCIDTLSNDDISKLTEHFTQMGLASSIEGMFWCPVPLHMLTAEQEEHHAECGPHSMAVTLENNMLLLELLVRAQGRIHCSCIKYASSTLRTHMMEYIDDQLTQLAINA